MSLHEAARKLAEYPQFILWRLNGTDKIPIGPYGGNIDPHDPANWLTEAEAFAHAGTLGVGVGFVLTGNDPFFCLDVDHCISGGAWSPLALRMFELLPNAALELSQSGEGAHLWGTYWEALGDRRIKNPGLELYTDKRFIALTNNFIQGQIWIDFTPGIKQIITDYFAPREDVIQGDWTDKPRDDWEGPDDDDKLIKIAMGAKSAAGVFGDKATFRDLWNGDPDTLGKFYPSSTGDDFDHSSADMALCSHLAFYTGGDCERMDRLFRRSALNREKWEDRSYYREKTILPIIGSLREVFGARKKKERAAVEEKLKANVGELSKMSAREGSSFLTIEEQFLFFEGCVYIRGLHRIFIQGGFILDKGDFNIAYGGRTFVLDSAGAKVTKDAWEAFTQNQGFQPPWADSMAFRPERLPGDVWIQEGKRFLNGYVPIDVQAQQGDVSPFFDFLNRFLPDQNDRNILISYMAAVVQYPGQKFPWCVVLQGVEGNGKSAIAKILQHAVGKRYTHLADPRQIDNPFNDWLLNKVFIAIEEIKAKGQWGIMESLKTMITGEDGPITAKGRDQITADYSANFMLFSNYKDAVHKTRNDRRYCVFYTAQQHESDLNSHGLTQAYFKNFYDWLKGKGDHAGIENRGYQYLTYWLKTLDIIAHYDPTKAANRAPRTSCYEEVIEANISPTHDEIRQAIDNYEVGFRGGWVSSVAIEGVLRRAGYKYPKKMYSELMKELGYIRCPMMPQGKAGRSLRSAPDAGKRPTLYVSKSLIENQIYRDVASKNGTIGLTDLYERTQTQA